MSTYCLRCDGRVMGDSSQMGPPCSCRKPEFYSCHSWEDALQEKIRRGYIVCGHCKERFDDARPAILRDGNFRHVECLHEREG